MLPRHARGSSPSRCTLVDLQQAPKDRTGRSANNINAVKNLISQDKAITLAAISLQTGMHQSTVHHIIHKDLHLKLHCAKFLPNFLTPGHIINRYQHSRDMLQYVRARPSFLKKIVTMDKAWCYQYDPLLKRQASQWLGAGETRPVHPRRTLSIKKILLVVFFNFKGMIHYGFLKQGTIDTATFIQILGRFWTALLNKRPCQKRSLHMDNAPAHMSRDTRLHLLLTGQKTLAHPALSPDLAPSDFWLFPTIKKPLRGHKFRDLDSLEEAVRGQIGLIPAADYRDTFLRK